jgi:hypothetical protein
MLKLLRYIPTFVFAIALLFATLPAMAGGDDFQGEKVTLMSGDQLAISSTVTSDSFDFGFTSDFVRVCIEADSGAEGALLRFGHTVDDSAPAFGPAMNMTILATTEAIFRSGSSNVLEGRAIRLMQAGDGSDTSCITEPWRTNGVTIGFSLALMGSGTATVDVTAFQTSKDRLRR